MGIFVFALVASLLIGLLLTLLRFIMCFRKGKVLIDKAKRAVFWGAIIKLIQGGFLAYCYSCFSAIYLYATNSPIQLEDFIASFPTLVFLFTIIVVTYYKVSKADPDYLMSPKIKKKYGAIYSGIDVYRKEALYKIPLFYVTRVVVAVILANNFNFAV